MAGLGKTKAAYASKGGEAKRAAKPAPSRHSGGTSGHLSLPGYKTKTPVSRTPYSPSEPPTPVQQSIRSEGTSRRQAARTQRITAQRRQRKATERKVASVLHQIAAKHQNASVPASKVAHDYSVPASKDPKVLAANREGAAGFAKEQRQAPQVKQVPVAAHIRNVPIRRPNVQQNPGTAKISSKPQPVVLPAERKAARAKLQRAKAAVRKTRVASALPGLDAEGQQVARQVLRTGKKMGASRKEMLAAAETGIVETGGFHNLPIGAETSGGWRQEQHNFYPEPTNVKKGAENFFNEAKTDPSIPGGGGETAGQLAQTVQGSAYPERYDEHRSEAAAIVRAFYGGSANPKAIKNLKAAKAEARELGLRVGGPGVGKAPPKLVKRTVVAEHAMKEVEGEPYVWGGGHGSPTSSPTGGGLDCSGAVGYVLNKVGAMKGSLTSGEMGSVLKPGPGALTVFYNAGHTFLRLINRKGEPEYWGTSVGDSGAGGLTRHPTPSASYLAEYSVGHVPGMGKKQALQLGASPGSLTGTSPESFPGMTFSPSGTTAKITPGSGATKPGKPGFSKRPIKLTPTQEYNQRKRALRQAGVPLGRGSAAEAPKGKVLAELESRYGRAAV